MREISEIIVKDLKTQRLKKDKLTLQNIFTLIRKKIMMFNNDNEFDEL